jgi:hypothetical protein
VDTTSYKSLLTMMSPALRGEVSTETNVAWTDSISCLHKCPSPLLIEFALHMEHVIFPPMESIVWPVRPACDDPVSASVYRVAIVFEWSLPCGS